MSEKFPPVLNACLSAGAVLAGMVGYLLLPPVPPGAAQVFAAAFLGSQPTQQAPDNRHADIRRVTAEEAKDLPNPVFVDVRTQGEYERGHIKGAIWLPFEQVAQQASTLPKDRHIVLYCT